MSRQWRDGNCNVNIIKEVMCMLLENIQYTTAIEETIHWNPKFMQKYKE